MPRQKRVDEAGVTCHAINRVKAHQSIFLKHEDCEAFSRVLSEGLEKYTLGVFSFALIPNHWHLVLRQQRTTL
jgi:REP element-mobilizing transposase RayT